MAVEAPPHSHLFSPQFLSNNRDIFVFFVLFREMIIDQGNKSNNVYGNDVKFGYGMNMNNFNQMENNNGMFPMMYASSGMNMADSGLTYSGLPISRKRSRETSSFDHPSFPNSNAQFVEQNQVNNDHNNDQRVAFTFLGQDVSMQIYHQQVEIDRFIANHTEKVRSEIEATRRRNSMRLIMAAEEGINKRLRSKEEEIVKIGKLNSALEEKVKSLSIENHLWQQMAQTNEATANNLRLNLHRILTQIQIQNQNHQNGHSDKTADDVASCCGSNDDYDDDDRQSLPLTAAIGSGSGGGDCEVRDKNDRRWCRRCGKVESCVLLLPCRHLCVCSGCESAINVCPICKSSKNASVQVNMS
ncbi:hypothetical protein OSB04_007727 [Centaurea solstitialis]|uniref:RING-type domain-containing protein n=1 Tax=Centaurea solstitialis TaxID=347529 RepID=A0AA38WIR6_9ASTR|nr:hypothetical protein OSB04_007727 [Centaurea solstitialis]